MRAWKLALASVSLAFSSAAHAESAAAIISAFELEGRWSIDCTDKKAPAAQFAVPLFGKPTFYFNNQGRLGGGNFEIVDAERVTGEKVRFSIVPIGQNAMGRSSNSGAIVQKVGKKLFVLESQDPFEKCLN